MSIPAAGRLALSEADKKWLMRIGRHRSTLRGIVLRVEIVRAAAEGTANRAIARKLSTSLPTVLLWRKRYEAERLAGIATSSSARSHDRPNGFRLLVCPISDARRSVRITKARCHRGRNLFSEKSFLF